MKHSQFSAPPLKRLHGLFLAAFISLPSQMAFAHDYGKGNIKVDHPWARPSIVTTAPAATYLKIENDGDTDDTLLAAYVPETVAAAAELHQSSKDDNVAKMRMQLGGLTIAAGETVNFAPGGRHIMLIGLKKPLVDGDRFEMTLVFEDAGPIDVVVYVEEPEQGETAGDDHHAHH